MTHAGAILELKGSIQYIRRRTFIEIIYLIKHHNITAFLLKDTFSFFLENKEWQHSVANTENILRQQYISETITPIWIMTTN